MTPAAHFWSSWRVRADGSAYRFCWRCRLVQEEERGGRCYFEMDDRRIKCDVMPECGGLAHG